MSENDASPPRIAAPFARQAIGERARRDLHADDRRDAERNAGEKDAQAREAAAQVAQGEAQRGRAAGSAGQRGRRVHTATATGGVSSILPERMRITRSHRDGERGVVRDQRQRRSALARQLEHHVDDGAPGRPRRDCRSARLR